MADEEEVIQPMDEDDSLRAALESSYDADEAAGEAKEAGGSEEDTEVSARATDKKEETVEPPEEPRDEVSSESKPDDADGEEKAAQAAVRPPQSWTPALREKFNTLAPDIQAEITRRERDYSVGIQKHAEAAKFGTAIQETLRPFESVMAMENADPVTAVKELARFASTMRLGTQAQKAQTIAHLINSYGVDIDALDKVLVDEPVQTPEEERLEQMLQQRLAPFQQMIQEVQQGRQQYQQTTQQSHQKEIEVFAGNTENEFFNDVREDMADIIEIAERRGQQMDLKTAYDRAIALRPELSQIVASRTAAERLRAKTNAASSIPSSTRKPVSSDGEISLRDTIAAQL